jgi:amino acid adenylation domain-containing protein
MSTIELLSELRQLGIQLSTDGEKLRCNAPKEALTPHVRSQLADRKAEIIAFLHNCNQAVDATAVSIQPVLRDKALPLSFSQQRLWFLDRIEPNSSSYNINGAFRIQGDLNQQILQQSLDALVAHHEVLRTNYPTEHGNPIQVIAAPSAVELEIIDLQQYTGAEQDLQIQQCLDTAAHHRSFNLASDLMIRACLLELAPTDRILLVVMHHIATDGWSMGIFWEQLGQVYTALAEGKPNPLTPLQIQYADYAVWQREWLSSDVLAQQLDYWKQQLATVNPILELPTDRPRPAIGTYTGAIASIDLSPQLTTDLKALCQQQGTTLFMTLLAAFEILISRHSGQSDFIIASPIAGRTRTEVEGLIGFFLNTLLLNADLSGNPSFQALLDRVRQVALGAYSHQDIPFEKLIEELNPKRDLSRNPLFQVLFNLLNLEDSNLNLTGLTATPVNIPEVNSKFEMTLYVKEQERQIHFDLTYNTDLFARERIVEMLAQFEQLLTQIVADPTRQIQSYSLLTPGAQVLLPNPLIALPQPKYTPITTTFTNWATQTPNQTAIVQAARTWTYQELATAAQNIAQILRANNLSIGNTVAVSGDRSFGLIASMLGVLISGGVLLNLDPKLPEARQQVMLATAQAKYLLAVGNEGSTANLSADIQILTINSDTGKTSCPETIIDPNAALIDLPIDAAAYIFFTSGTTGVPKGVLGTHQGLAHFLTWQRETFSIVPEDRAAQLTGLSFDVVLRDIFLPLTSGATLCLPSITEDLTPGRILPWMEQQQITILHTVPTLAQSWLMNVPTGVSLRTLRRIFFAGEPLRDTLINQWRETFPAAGEIINLYGPTETTLAKCYYKVPKNIRAGIQPAGITLPQSQALVITPARQVCGIGETGEIAIRTPFRTKGYINGTIENQSQFINNPFRADAEDDLIYLTGDRGRYLPDGTLEILGRIDRQIKIRGVRIEPGEIAALLNQHPHIQATVVIAREDLPGDQRLVAYFVSKPNTKPQSSELRQFLDRQLPDYMVPSAFVMLTALPLTPNGKIDTRALPAPDLNRPESVLKFVAARDEFEIQLTKIWQQVLGIHTISITDNFFELGGHSLLAIRLFSEIERIWGKNLPLATLFQAQTIQKLADILRQEGWAAPWSSLVQIQPGKDSKLPLFCVHPIGGNILEYYQLAHYLDRDQPVYGLQSLGLDGKQIPLRCIEAMATHYIQEMRTIQPTGPYLLVGYSFAGMVAFEIAQQLDRQGEKVALLALLDRTSPTFVPIRPSLLQSAKIHFHNLRLLDRDGRMTYILSRISYKLIHKGNYREYMMGQWQSAISPEYINVFDANLQANEDYQAQVYSGAMTLFRCQVQPLNQALSADLGWSELVTGNLETYDIPTSHYAVLKEPTIQYVAQKLEFCINKISANIPRISNRLDDHE